jgi:CRP-like cAMP-binding protein
MVALPSGSGFDLDPCENFLYQRLPRVYQERWRPWLSRVDLDTNASVYEPGGKVTNFIFPTTAVVSMTSVSARGETALMGMVGCEGVIGLPALMSGEATVRAVVQNSGVGFQLEARFLVEAFHQDREIRALLLRYLQVYLTQVSQLVICNRHHPIESQLCTLLLRTMDRTRQDELAMTHELLGNLLGCRRETVSHAALRLHASKVLEYRRGRIQVVDRGALERMACECYTLVEQSYARLWVTPGRPASPGAHRHPELRAGRQLHSVE